MKRIVLLLLLAAVPVIRAADDKVSDAAKPLLGAWKDQEDKETLVRFEAARCTFAREGKPGFQVARATYEPGKVSVQSWGRTVVFQVEVKDGKLHLTMPDGKKKTFQKLDNIPGDLEAKALKLGHGKEVPADAVKLIQDELARREKIDQQVRTDPEKTKDMQRVDTENTEYLVKLVQDVGWIDAERFGARTSNAAFLIVQHSMHVPMMMAALPPIEKDVKAKRIDAQPYALLFDRLQLMLGEKQKYGTQLGANDKNELVVLPLEDRKKVEEIRKEIGLFPLADYLKFFEKQNGGKPVKFQDDSE